MSDSDDFDDFVFKFGDDEGHGLPDLPEEVREMILAQMRKMFEENGGEMPEMGMIELDSDKIPEPVKQLLEARMQSRIDPHWGSVKGHIDHNRNDYVEEIAKDMVPGVYVLEIEGEGSLKIGTIMHEHEAIADGYTAGDFAERWEKHQRPVHFVHNGCSDDHHDWLNVKDLTVLSEEEYKELRTYIEFVDGDVQINPTLWKVRDRVSQQQMRHLMPGSDRPMQCSSCGAMSLLMFMQHYITQAAGPMMREDGMIVAHSPLKVSPMDIDPEETSEEVFARSKERHAVLHCMACGHVEEVDPDKVRMSL